MTKEELLEQAEIVRTQTEENGNTADLVGSVLRGIISLFDSLLQAISRKASEALSLVTSLSHRTSVIEGSGWVTTQRLGDGSVTTGKIADGAVTSAKIVYPCISVESLDALGYVDSGPSRYIVTSVHRGRRVNVGVLDVLSDSFRHVLTQVLTTHYAFDSEKGVFDFDLHYDDRIVSVFRSYALGSGGTLPPKMWTKWKYVNSDVVEERIQTIARDTVSNIYSWVIVEGDKKTILADSTDTLHLSYRMFNHSKSNFAIYVNGVLLKEEYGIGGELDIEVSGETHVRVEAIQHDYTYSGVWDVGTALPVYIGSGSSYEEVLGVDSFKQPLMTDVSGSYAVTVETGGRFYLCVPSTLSVPTVKMNGFTMLMGLSHVEYEGSSYSVYSSLKTYQGGSYVLQVGAYESSESIALDSVSERVDSIEGQLQELTTDVGELSDIVGDKAHEPSDFSGSGRVRLRKNLAVIAGNVFDGFVENVDVASVGVVGTPDEIYYDRENGYFVGYFVLEDKYYRAWSDSNSETYTMPEEGTLYVFDGQCYAWHEAGLAEAEGLVSNLLTQSMMNSPHTIYHIQYDYDLNGGSIVVPEGCVLKFEGGSLCNGRISLSGAKVLPDYNALLKEGLEIEGFPAAGTFYLPDAGHPKWSDGERWVDGSSGPGVVEEVLSQRGLDDYTFDGSGIFHKESDGRVFPVSHPSLSTNPSILPQKFGANLIKEVLLPNNGYRTRSVYRISDAKIVGYINGSVCLMKGNVSPDALSSIESMMRGLTPMGHGYIDGEGRFVSESSGKTATTYYYVVFMYADDGGGDGHWNAVAVHRLSGDGMDSYSIIDNPEILCLDFGYSVNDVDYPVLIPTGGVSGRSGAIEWKHWIVSKSSTSDGYSAFIQCPTSPIGGEYVNVVFGSERYGNMLNQLDGTQVGTGHEVRLDMDNVALVPGDNLGDLSLSTDTTVAPERTVRDIEDVIRRSSMVIESFVFNKTKSSPAKSRVEGGVHVFEPIDSTVVPDYALVRYVEMENGGYYY